jgi:hypothetical protein
LPLADSKNFATAWRMNLTFLRGCLPPNSQHLLLGRVRKYGRYPGVPIECPTCNAKPPREVPQHARWRWMSFHQMTAHRRS